MRHILYRARALVQALALGAALTLQAAAFLENATLTDIIVTSTLTSGVYIRPDTGCEIQPDPHTIVCRMDDLGPNAGSFAFSYRHPA